MLSSGLTAAISTCTRTFKGNHEAALIEVYRGDQEALSFWRKFGGQATMAGLGIDESLLATASMPLISPKLQTSLHWDIVDWLAELPHSWTLGDYFFVHAGIKPRVQLSRQDQYDLLWIRKPIIASKRRHEKVIIHGHTVEPGLPCLGSNRIGIDTGRMNMAASPLWDLRMTRNG